MAGTVISDIERADPDVIDGLAACGVSTIYEAQGRTGLLASTLRPLVAGTRIAGSAITISCSPTSNLMNHVALAYARAGDIILIVPDSPSDIAYAGDLFAAAALARGCRGLIVDAAVRDVRDLRELGLPVWSRCISPHGPSTLDLGDVNVPVACGDAYIRPGDILAADDDGVCVIRRDDASHVLAQARARQEDEHKKRTALLGGQPGLDLHGLRPLLASKGLNLP
ncbi:4-carboxy-4-hydroxy-2-oxoadipate aldolase/oxaloacetate decarboxylase [Sphingobium sp. DC-2]|uniref:4-carboxy-4-hydroxy-2-oxoadipate aldolase/oxaloacetate decarboxylase n=1 Tax=Sphingobium sp. DC-2 TaxID=1303256 RepID=UPI0004C37C70|nr:4-carboxy-4-hydroxy-2-oxoadipate aldolase/oxaloacetate decarboxylase [Sphingobium sp. DC-2]